MKGEQAYSVRVPAGLPHVGSAAVCGMLARLFRERTPLAVGPPVALVTMRELPRWSAK